MSSQTAKTPRRLALISSQAFSLINFRGPLIRDWAARGIEVFALAPDFDAASRSAVVALGATPVDFRLERVGMRPLRDVCDLFALRRVLAGLAVDSSFAYFVKPAIYGTLAARFAGVRRRFVMIEGAGYVFADETAAHGPGRRLLRKVVEVLYKVALIGAERVFFLNPDDVELFVSRALVQRERSLMLGGIGVDLDHFRPEPRPDGPPVFLLAARLLEHKGVREYVRAAQLIRSRHPDVRFILLGSPDLNPASVAEEEVRRWQDEGHIEWQPHVADVRPWIARASVVVLPSWYREGVPRSLQEAMAMARAVVTTDMPGCRDAVAHEETGLLVPPRDEAALVAALMRFVEHPELADRMGVQGRGRAEAQYDVHAINARILQAMGIDRDA